MNRPKPGDNFVLPADMVPSWKTFYAIDRGVERNLLFKTWGGLGDQVCAEPALRYAAKLFPTSKLALATEHPSLFQHLQFFNEKFDLNQKHPVWEDYFVFSSIEPPEHLLWQFVSHLLCHPVDFSSLCMFRLQLPVADREIKLPDFEPFPELNKLLKELPVIIHAGKHWPSKTFPAFWWSAVVKEFVSRNFKVVLIGKEVDANVGFVSFNLEGLTYTDAVKDLRNKLSLPELIYLLKNCSYVFTNDSSPIHIAASGDAFIGFVASCKHPDFLYHWRKGVFGRDMKNFGLDGVWNHIDHSPVQKEKVEVEFLPSGLMDKILPDPREVVSHYVALRKAQYGI